MSTPSSPLPPQDVAAIDGAMAGCEVALDNAVRNFRSVAAQYGTAGATRALAHKLNESPTKDIPKILVLCVAAIARCAEQEPGIDV